MELEAARGRGDSATKESMANTEGFVLAYAGRLQEARAMSRRAEDFARQADRKGTEALYQTDAAVREALFGNAQAAKQSATAALRLSQSRDLVYGAALAGDSSRSQGLVDDLSRRFPEDTRVRFAYMPTLLALLALNHNAPSKAVELLQTAIPYEDGVRSAGSEILIGAGTLYPNYVRGQAYLAAGQGREAAIEFQKILAHRGIVLSDPIGALAQLQLARAYAFSGDRDNARAAYKDFLSLWKNADSSIPVFNQAKAEYAKLQ
jgi:hypothetical protein